MNRSLLCGGVLVAASLLGCFPDAEDDPDDPDIPLIDTVWAKNARGVGHDEEAPRRAVYATYDNEDGERERKALTALREEKNLGNVVITLKKGVYELPTTARINRARSLTIKGKGPHETRLELHSEQRMNLRILKVKKVKLSNLTVVGYRGAGIYFKDCPNVKVTNAHFAAARYGLNFENSVASITTSVFAGCQTGVRARSSSVSVRESMFYECWEALSNKRGAFDVETCGFVDGHDVAVGRLDGRSRFVGNLFFGKKQSLWEGRPGLASSNLAQIRDLDELLGRETNVEMKDFDDFPDHVQWPKDLDVAALHLAIERGMKRGEEDPEESLNDIRTEWAEKLARSSQAALKRGLLEKARKYAKYALQYYGDKPLQDAPEALIEIAELAK